MKKQLLTLIVATSLLNSTTQSHFGEDVLTFAGERPGQVLIVTAALLAGPVYLGTEYGVKPLATGVEKVAKFLRKTAGQTTIAYSLGCLTGFYVVNFLQQFCQKTTETLIDTGLNEA